MGGDWQDQMEDVHVCGSILITLHLVLYRHYQLWSIMSFWAGPGIASYAAIFSVTPQLSGEWGSDTENGCIGGYVWRDLGLYWG